MTDKAPVVENHETLQFNGLLNVTAIEWRLCFVNKETDEVIAPVPRGTQVHLIREMGNVFNAKVMLAKLRVTYEFAGDLKEPQHDYYVREQNSK